MGAVIFWGICVVVYMKGVLCAVSMKVSVVYMLHVRYVQCVW